MIHCPSQPSALTIRGYVEMGFDSDPKCQSGDDHAQSSFHGKAAWGCGGRADTSLKLEAAETRSEAQKDALGSEKAAARKNGLSLALKEESMMQRHGNGKTHIVDGPLLASPHHLAFVYGTLKKGFGNHWLMEELLADGHAHFVGVAQTKNRFPLVCGPFQVPFLLDVPASGHHVRGELYQVDNAALARLDDLEGLSKGHYVRRPVVLTGLEFQNAQQWDISLDSAFLKSVDLLAEAYFAASNYTPAMARAGHIDCYTEKEASTYIRRKDRPQNRTFLEHVFAWIEEQGFNNSC